jgi:putative salt-induced outer membrane protein YdiY
MKRVRELMILAVVGAVVTTTAMGQEQGSFATRLSVGATLTDGNSETMQANAALVTEGKKDGLGSVRAGVEANYGETTTKTTDEAGVVVESTDTTVENARLFAGAKKTITERTFGSVDASVLYDDVAEIDYRAMISPGLGVYLVKNESTSLSVDAGPAYIWEHVAGVTEDYVAVRFGERIEHAFSKTAKVWQSAEYLPGADDFGDYLLNAEIGAEAAMNSRVNLRIVLQDKYDSTPGEGLEKNDLVLIAGVSMSL